MKSVFVTYDFRVIIIDNNYVALYFTSTKATVFTLYIRTAGLRKQYRPRRHAYSNILQFSPPKTENLQIKKSDSFIFLLKTLSVGTR